MLVRPYNIVSNFFEQTTKDSEWKKINGNKTWNFDSTGRKMHIDLILHGCLSCRMDSKADPILAVTDPEQLFYHNTFNKPPPSSQ
jgi:hypothetical protein